jgi:hypothetical protein
MKNIKVVVDTGWNVYVVKGEGPGGVGSVVLGGDRLFLRTWNGEAEIVTIEANLSLSQLKHRVVCCDSDGVHILTKTAALERGFHPKNYGAWMWMPETIEKGVNVLGSVRPYRLYSE